ncbi:MAG TPA: cytochrome c oxidase subunit II [Solirubrobacteraceae bacterium]|jgi:cytochrome c oxidase subunit 2|nr:cytochrome c oxidase subunit II [Solirubrobacteraceae bacterium]
MEGPNHLRRFVTLWLVSSAIATPLAVLLIGPILPPGKATEQAAGQVTDNTVLLGMATPVLLLVVLYLVYAVVYFRQPRGAVLEGPGVRGDARVQATWLVVTVALVLALAAYGTATLYADNGAGSGSGPSPITVPKGSKLPVQVIAQQWYFTYRYPTYGGVETPHLVLPVDQMIELHVTSLDVIHSFWAYQLGVKADANPQVDNIAFVKPTKTGSFEVRCAELCGIWHGEMFDHGNVVTREAFATWIHQAQVKFAPATKTLPPYSRTYLPEPTRRGE